MGAVTVGVLVCAPAAERIWVSTSGTQNGPGTQQAPFDDVQTAIDDAVDGDTVWVLGGTYSSRYGIRFKGKKIVLKSAYGPFATILRPSFFPFMRFDQNEDSNTVVDGFTLGSKSGEATGNLSVLVVDSASPRIKNMVIRGFSLNAGFYQANTSILHIHGTGSAPLIHNCLLASNSVGVGVSARIVRLGSGVTPLMDKCTIADSRKTLYSGTTSYSSTFVDAYRMKNSIVYGHTLPGTVSNPNYVNAVGTGGGVVFSDVEGGQSGTGNINSDPGFDGGSYQLAAGSPCINTGDPSSPLDPDGSRIDMGFAYSPDWIPQLRFAYARDSTNKEVGIDADDYVELRFSSPGAYPWPEITESNVDSLFHINNGHSLLSGAGVLGAVGWDATHTILCIHLDLAGGPPSVAPGDTIDFLGLGIKTYLRGSFSPNSIRVQPGHRLSSIALRCGPNPSTGNTFFRFGIGEGHGTWQKARVTITNAQGRIVRVLRSGPLTAGHHSIEWDGKGRSGIRLPNATYFGTLQLGDRSGQRVKMVLGK